MKKEPREIIKYPDIHGVLLTDRTSPESFPAHWHNEAEFTVALKDGCKYRVGDKLITLQKQDVLLVWPRELHEIIHAPENGSYFIQFSSDLLENNLDIVSMFKFMTEYHHIEYLKEPDLAKKIADKLEEVKCIVVTEPHFAETRCKLIIYEIILLIGEYVMHEKQLQLGAPRLSDASWKHIQEACSYISEHSADSLTQTEVASHIGLSPYYFSRLFREYMQMTFPAYLSGIRVRTAIRLLANESISITDAAFQSGFQSTTAFNKVFHDITGCSPRDYRKMLRVQS